MGDDETKVLPLGLDDDFLLSPCKRGRQGVENAGEVAVTPARYCQDKLQRVATGEYDRLQLVKVVEG